MVQLSFIIVSTVWLQLQDMSSLFGTEQSPDPLLEERVLRPFEDAPEMATDLTRINVLSHLIELVHVIDDAALDIQIVFDLFVVDHCADSMAELIRLASSFSPAGLVVERALLVLRIVQDLTDAHSRLLEIVPVPFIVLGPSEEEPGLSRKDLVSGVRIVDHLLAGLLQEREMITRDPIAATIIGTILDPLDEPVVNGVRLTPVHDVGLDRDAWRARRHILDIESSSLDDLGERRLVLGIGVLPIGEILLSGQIHVESHIVPLF